MKKCFILTLLLLFSLFNVGVAAEEKYPYIIEETPEVDSEYVYFENISTSQVLLETKADELMYPASITKVMTCLVALDNLDDLNKEVMITEPMIEGLWEMNASVAGLNIGVNYTIKDLLYGTMLPSGADAARALAITVSGSINNYVELMNDKAQTLGMDDTQFQNVDGLHNSEHYSTAKDLAILMKEALKYPIFCEISSAPAYTLSDGHKVYSSLFFFAKDEIRGLKGGKTGFTGPAGRCLMSYGQISNNDLILVTGKASDMNHISDAKTIYNWYFDNIETVKVVDKAKLIASVAVEDSSENIELDFYPSSSYVLDIEKDAIIKEVIDLPENVYAPLEEDQVIGYYKVFVNDQLVYSEELAVNKKIERSNLKYYLRQIKEFLAGFSSTK